MGVRTRGILIEFDCDTLEEPITLTASQPQATVATVTLIINQNNLAWLTAYLDWEVIQAANRDLTLSIFRDDTRICSATDSSGGQATSALTCCDKNLSAGPRTYRLVAESFLEGTGTIIINQGTLTGAQIKN